MSRNTGIEINYTAYKKCEPTPDLTEADHLDLLETLVAAAEAAGWLMGGSSHFIDMDTAPAPAPRTVTVAEVATLVTARATETRKEYKQHYREYVQGMADAFAEVRDFIEEREHARPGGASAPTWLLNDHDAIRAMTGIDYAPDVPLTYGVTARERAMADAQALRIVERLRAEAITSYAGMRIAEAAGLDRVADDIERELNGRRK